MNDHGTHTHNSSKDGSTTTQIMTEIKTLNLASTLEDLSTHPLCQQVFCSSDTWHTNNTLQSKCSASCKMQGKSLAAACEVNPSECEVRTGDDPDTYKQYLLSVCYHTDAAQSPQQHKWTWNCKLSEGCQALQLCSRSAAPLSSPSSLVRTVRQAANLSWRRHNCLYGCSGPVYHTGGGGKCCLLHADDTQYYHSVTTAHLLKYISFNCRALGKHTVPPLIGNDRTEWKSRLYKDRNAQRVFVCVTHGAEVSGKLTVSQFQLHFFISISKEKKVTTPTQKKKTLTY